jgi:hypothetical protein
MYRVCVVLVVLGSTLCCTIETDLHGPRNRGTGGTRNTSAIIAQNAAALSPHNTRQVLPLPEASRHVWKQP